MQKFLLNAVLSLNMDKGRKSLATVVKTQRDRSTHLNFVKISKQFQRDVNGLFSKQLSTDNCAKILLKSVFSLARACHNLECYRL